MRQTREAVELFFKNVPLDQAVRTRDVGTLYGYSDQTVNKWARKWAVEQGLTKTGLGCPRGSFRFRAPHTASPATVLETVLDPAPDSLTGQLVEIFTGAPTGRLFDTHLLATRVGSSAGMVSYAGRAFARQHGLIKQRVGKSGFLFAEPEPDPVAVPVIVHVEESPLSDDDWDTWQEPKGDQSVMGRLVRIELKLDILLREWGVES